MTTGATQPITKGRIAAYILLPQVWPRINAIYAIGFSRLAYMLALVYRGIGLLPRGHAIFTSGNRDIGLLYVFGAASAELKFTRRHMDQVILYFLILLGLVLLAAQLVLTVGYIFVNPAFAQAAQPQTYGDFFQTANKNDLAYKLLFSVFGVPDLFKPGGAPSPFHVALHSLFQLYSVGLLVVAAIIVCYFIFAIFVETAQTGVPFGRRYNHVWAPIRLVFALGLLVPIGYGLNAGQWIVLYSAKFGSDFATKGWSIFSKELSDRYVDPNQRSVGTPQTPDLVNLAAFMMVVDGCKYAYTNVYYSDKTIDGYLIKPGDEGAQQKSFSSMSFEDAKTYFNQGDIVIRFGEHDPNKHAKHLGKVAPYCGDIIIPAADSRENGSLHIQEYYYDVVKDLFQNNTYEVKKYGENFVKMYRVNTSGNNALAAAELPPADYAKTLREKLTKATNAAIKEAVQKQEKSETWNTDLQNMKDYGWAGAGIWYNKLAQVNGSLITAVNNIPQIRLNPFVLEYVKSEQLQQNQAVPDPAGSLFQADGREMQFDGAIDRDLATSLTEIQKYWSNADVLGPEANPTGNFFVDAINLVFGTSGLFNMCANVDVHPLGQLSMLGKGLMEASIRNLGLGYGFKFLTIMGGAVGSTLGAISSIFLSIATISMTMGFILFYVVPFLPFMYFFFAVVGWVKGIFEAMVGVPLWALAHLRIDGEGLQGDAAKDGLYLIFEIFIRPILIVFGLLAAVIIFAAMIKVLNEIFFIVATNLSGHDEQVRSLCGKSLQGGGQAATSGDTSSIAYYRGPIDEFFFTVMYAIIVYMIGLSCFKLIDLIPNNILRYMGVSAHTFNDMQEDLAGGMLRNVTVATNSASDTVFGSNGAISGGIDVMAKGGQGAAADAGRMLGGR